MLNSGSMGSLSGLGEVTVVLMLTRQEMARMEDENPAGAALLQRAVLRSLCECIGSGVLESLSGIELAAEG